MSNPTDPQRAYASTYFVQDRANQDELARLQIQDSLLTAGMGGVLEEQIDPTSFRRVLDVGCGTGGWLIETAKRYPEIKELIGIDVSKPMLEAARTQAQAQGVGDRVQFQVMDALLVLEFPPAYFDLVNQRCAGSFLRTWEWEKVLDEYQRVCRPGGVIRVSEPGILQPSTSPALNRHFEQFQCAMYRSGHLFEYGTRGITAHVARLLTQYGIQQVQEKTRTLEYRAGTAEGRAYYQNMIRAFRTLRPFLQKWGCLSVDYDELYQQILQEGQQPDFQVSWEILTAWGTRRPYAQFITE